MDFKDIKIPDCKYFSGYKPCFPGYDCLKDGCKMAQSGDNTHLHGKNILIISLDALGNVLLNTSILRSLKKKYPVSTIHWITMKSALPILSNNEFIDRIYSWEDTDRMILSEMKFDILLNGDKSVYACAFANTVNASDKYGFILNESGKIIPANESAIYNYTMGINDELKFRKNMKSGSEIIHETFGLDYARDEYVFSFSAEEINFIEKYREQIKYDRNNIYIGLNTGCSNLFPNKKMTIEQHVALIMELSKRDEFRILLLGGKEDTERNLRIHESLDRDIQNKIIYTPTNLGIRNGACFMDVCDIVVTGDSFGMHLAIALKKYVIAWFGLSCWNEIDLFDRGEKLIPTGLECAPCWKKECPYNLECIVMIDISKIAGYIKKYALMKPLFSSKN
ncbi:MAG: glycosyltransferase family 9 protein [Bacteroidetes bacterium]|nr:glycosyltransferase family 9 protein [Bacteroidota bacterium]